MKDRFHIVNDSCHVAGGEDHGAVDSREEAEAKIEELLAEGKKGGCLHGGSGWKIKTCSERQSFDIWWISNRWNPFQTHARPSEGEDIDLTEEERAQHQCWDFHPVGALETLRTKGHYLKRTQEREITEN